MELSARIDRVEARTGQVVGYATLVIDGAFLVHGVRIIHRAGSALVDMPSDRLHLRCRRCPGRNRDDARFCQRCGTADPGVPPPPRPDGTPRSRFTSVCHPAHSDARREIEAVVLAAYAEYSAVPIAGGVGH